MEIDTDIWTQTQTQLQTDRWLVSALMKQSLLPAYLVFFNYLPYLPLTHDLERLRILCYAPDQVNNIMMKDRTWDIKHDLFWSTFLIIISKSQTSYFFLEFMKQHCVIWALYWNKNYVICPSCNESILTLTHGAKRKQKHFKTGAQ